jgi:hypothetical protein
MSRFNLIMVILFSIVFLISGCGMVSTETPAPTPVSTEPEVIEQDVEEVQYEVVFLENAQGQNTVDAYLQNVETKEMLFFATIHDVQQSHYHYYEFLNGNLYIVRRLGDYEETDNWTDELWRYREQDEGTRLYAIKGLDFRVSPTEEYIAAAGGETIVGEKLVILDAQGNLIQEYTAEQVVSKSEIMIVGLLEWSDDGSQLWMRSGGPGLISFSRLAVTSWNITIYNVTEIQISLQDHALNPNTGKVVFSDHPVFFDATSAEEFRESQTDVNLFVFDLETRNLQQIITSKAKEFNPIWLDEVTIEYNDPFGDDRISVVVEN